MSFRHGEKTLTDEEIDRIMEKITLELKEQFGASMRQM